MELSNEFDVAAPIDRAWRVLTDLERIAPCLPGAQLLEVEGDEHRGAIKVKVGPIVAQYKGKARFTERDEDAQRAYAATAKSDEAWDEWIAAFIAHPSRAIAEETNR